MTTGIVYAAGLSTQEQDLSLEHNLFQLGQKTLVLITYSTKYKTTNKNWKETHNTKTETQKK